MQAAHPPPPTAASDANPPTLLSVYFRLLDSSPGLLHLRLLHARLLRTGLFANPILSTKLLLSYSRRHRRLLSSALAVFRHMPSRNSFAWNSLLVEFARSALPRLSLRFFIEMHSSGVPVDQYTLPPVLRSCAMTGSSGTGMAVHCLSAKLGLVRNQFIASALVLFYAGLSETMYARCLFDEMGERDVVLWTSMLSAYAQGGESELALRFFGKMVCEGMQLDGVVMVSLLLACGHLGRLRDGKSVHACSIRRFLVMPLSLGNALIDMYVKSGKLECAERVFMTMPCRDVISWSALILGHGLNGHADVALHLFNDMNTQGIEPNTVSFLGALSACGHAGMVDKASELFDRMKKGGMEPELKHYSCLADALGRSGRLVEAERLTKEMPVEPDEAILGALLAACRLHGNLEVAERVSRRLMMMCPEKSGYYLSLANAYSDLGRFGDAEKVRDFMKLMNVGKLPGWSSVESDGFISVTLAS